MNNSQSFQGAGLGLKLELLDPLQQDMPGQINFLEVAPENWMTVGGKLGKRFRWFTEQTTVLCHGLSLNLGGSTPLDEAFIKQLKGFLTEHSIPLYSEHLSYCGDDGHMYDLMPIPFTEEAVHHTAERIKRTQDILEQRIAIENASYYAELGKEMEEIDFIHAVLNEADCDLLLDVNNIYVNSINHKYNAEEFLARMPADRIAYIHVAGHYNEAADLIIDTHGASVIDPVWDLLDKAYAQHGIHPTLLERDFNIPSVEELLKEIDVIHTLQDKNKGNKAGQHASKHKSTAIY